MRKKNGFQRCFLHWLHRCWSDQHVQDDVTLKMGLMVMTTFGEENGAGKGNVGYQKLGQGNHQTIPTANLCFSYFFHVYFICHSRFQSLLHKEKIKWDILLTYLQCGSSVWVNTCLLFLLPKVFLCTLFSPDMICLYQELSVSINFNGIAHLTCAQHGVSQNSTFQHTTVEVKNLFLNH